MEYLVIFEPWWDPGFVAVKSIPRRHKEAQRNFRDAFLRLQLSEILSIEY